MPHTQDDGFHEIQLNGKQLVFLFMAVTVVSVVIFLFGVLVGRGVHAERGAAADAAAPSAVEAAPEPPPPAPANQTASDPRTVEPPPTPTSDVPPAYSNLDRKSAPPEPLKSAPEKPAAKPARPEKAAPTATAGAADDAPAAREPSGQGFAVQIAALNVRSEADAIARRLAAKGYSAYVLAPANGSPAVFRVRVGKFATRREAETVAARLQKEEQFKPWVTR